MYRTSEFLKRIYKKSFKLESFQSCFGINTKKYLHEHINKNEKLTRIKAITRSTVRTRAERKKIERKLQFKEKLKFIVVSSIYFFSADYLYHTYVLKDEFVKKKNKQQNEDNHMKTPLSNSNLKKEEKKDALMSYFKREHKINVNTKEGIIPGKKDNWNEKKELKQENTSKEIAKSEKEENKIINTDENENEVKINRINKKKSNDNTILKHNFFEKINSDWFNSIFDNGKEEIKKDIKENILNTTSDKNRNANSIGNKTNSAIFAHDFYQQHFLNGCNLFLFANGIVFLGWRLSEIMRNKKLYNFMCRHFICSYENVKEKRYHTLFTAGISHITFPHFLFNTYAFYTISNSLLSPEIKENKRKYFFFNYKSNVLEKKITDVDILNVCMLSSLFSTFFYILLHKNNKILGASGSIMGLIYISSTVKPNDVFVSLFPFPYLKLTSLQLCHLTIITNFIFLFFKRNLLNVAWSAHLFGLMGGVVYNLYQRKNNNCNYYPFWKLTVENGKIDYLNSYLDFVDFLSCSQLKMQLLFTLDVNKERFINNKIRAIQSLQMQRRIKYTEQKRRNMDAMVRRVISNTS